MRSMIAVAIAALIPTTLLSGTSEVEDIRPIVAMGAYIPTDDMDGSEAFYRTLFDQAPAIDLPDFIAFQVAGGCFAIVSRAKYAPDGEAGSGAIPYLQSTDLMALKSRLSAAGLPSPEIITEPGIQLLKITDPNDQLVEFFMLTNQ